MCSEKNEPCNIASHYQIIVEGKIDPSWSEWLANMEVRSRKEADGMQVTILSGILADQAALRGLLIRLWDLNLSLRSVEQIDPSKIQALSKENKDET
jgi:hypothetical protein